LVASQGFEPQYAESESAVLPLNDEATDERRHPSAPPRADAAAVTAESQTKAANSHIIRGMAARGQSGARCCDSPVDAPCCHLGLTPWQFAGFYIKRPHSQKIRRQIEFHGTSPAILWSTYKFHIAYLLTTLKTKFYGDAGFEIPVVG
jgi:hypothetical protein